MIKLYMSVENIYNFHVTYIKNNDEFYTIIDSIIGDMFMGRVKFIDNKLYINVPDIVLHFIKKWYILSEILKKYNSCELVLYRGMNNLEVLDKIIQPIPFSTCIDYNNATLWSNNGFVMKINVKSNVGYTFTGNLNEGNEVILPAGYLFCVGKQEDYIEYEYEDYSFTKMCGLLS